MDKLDIYAAISYSKYENDATLEKLSTADIILCHQHVGIGAPLPTKVRNRLLPIMSKIKHLRWNPPIIRYNAQMALEKVTGRGITKIDY